MSPLKIAISAFVVGLIGLTASATKDAESSSIPSSEYVPRPLEKGLKMQDVEAFLGPGPELQNYKMNLKHYNTHRGPESSSTTKPIPFLPYVLNEISKVENQVIEKKRLQVELQRLQEERQKLEEENQRLEEERQKLEEERQRLQEAEQRQEDEQSTHQRRILAEHEQWREWDNYMAEQATQQRRILAEHERHIGRQRQEDEQSRRQQRMLAEQEPPRARQRQEYEQSRRQRQIHAEYREGTPTHSNPTLPGGGDPSTTGDHN